MIEIRIHGRGGQGAVTSAELLAVAAFKDGRHSQAFPFFGTERAGAPVAAFCRIDDNPIRLREHVYTPDYVLVLDPTLITAVDVRAGLKKGGLVIVNSTSPPERFDSVKVKTVDLTKIALETIGRPFVNVAALGAFAAVTGLVSLDSLIAAVNERFQEKIAVTNIAAMKRAYDEMKK